MESLRGNAVLGHHYQSGRRLPLSGHLPPLLPNKFSSFPITNATPKPTNLSIRATSSPPPANPRRHNSLPETLAALLKPSFVALTATAALFLSAVLRKSPSLMLAHAAVAPPAQSETQKREDDRGAPTDAEKERFLEDRLAANPEDAACLQALMELRIKQQRLPEAVTLIDRLILIEPGEKELLLLRAHLQNYAGDAEASRVGFEEIIRKDPLVVEAYHGLVMLAAQEEESGSSNGDLGGVLKRIEAAMEGCKAEKRKEELRDFRLLVAQIKFMEGELETALGVYQDLVKEEPRDFRPYLCQGIIYSLMQRKDEADKQFEKYRRLVPKEHPYAEYIDDNMASMMALGQMQGSKGT